MWQWVRLGSIIYILKSNSLFQRTTGLVLPLFLSNLVLMLLVPHSESPGSTWVLQPQQVGSVPSPAPASFFLAGEPSQHPGECPLQAGRIWKCRDISDSGATCLITHAGQSWVLSMQFLRGSPVGLSPIIHDETDPWVCLQELFPLPRLTPKNHLPRRMPASKAGSQALLLEKPRLWYLLSCRKDVGSLYNVTYDIKLN